MSHKPVHTSEVNVLQHLIDGPQLLTVVFDPAGQLVTDDAAPCSVADSAASLEAILQEKGDSKVCVINLAAAPLPAKDIDFIVEFNQPARYPSMKPLTLQYINNPDRRMRWLYPAHIRRPLFLAFYNFTYWKARLYKIATRTAFFFRLTRLLSHGQVTVYAASQALFVTSLVNSNNNTRKSNYAVFAGTAGPNRKLVVADAARGYLSHFFKIALNAQSARNIRNEYTALKQLDQFAIRSFSFPGTEDINRHTICISNIKPAATVHSRGWTDAHTAFLQEMAARHQQKKKFLDTAMAVQVNARMQRIEATGLLKDFPAGLELFRQLQLLQQALADSNPGVITSFGHGDFTRWNCYQAKDKLHVYDWEMHQPDMPLLFDLFHFVIQGAIFEGRKLVSSILSQINELLHTEGIMAVTDNCNADTALQFQLYLLCNCSYYLEVYLQQKNLHKEAYWLFGAWHEMLQNETASTSAVSMRRQFIKALFPAVGKEKYTVLKNAGKPVSGLSEDSDIDMLVSPEAEVLVLAFASRYRGVIKNKISRKSFMTTMELFFSDGSYLSIDLLRAFHRKSIAYLDAGLLLNNSITANGIKILPPAFDYLYIYLFYQINHAAVPEKYSRWFLMVDNLTETAILETLRQQTGIEASHIEDTFAFSAENRKKMLLFTAKNPSNRPLRRAVRWCRHQFNNLSSLLHNRGFMLTFSGVDGAGKSTILNEVKDMLQQKYRKKVVVIRHRPSMLPILSAWKYGKEEAERKCVESLPRQGRNKSLLSSISRFSYYYLDYILGQLLVYCRYTLRGYIVLYDRYYFDFIVDGRRSNISINKSFIKNLYLFVYKPQLNIFLYAPPEIILKRKKELSAADITQLTTEYTHLFGSLGNTHRYLCIENIDKARTMSRIEQAIVRLN